MGNLSAAMLVFNDGEMSEGVERNSTLDNGDTFAKPNSGDIWVEGDEETSELGSGFVNATSDMEVMPMVKQFDAIPVVIAGLAGFYGYNKFKGKKYGMAYAGGIALAGLLLGGFVSKGIYGLKKSI